MKRREEESCTDKGIREEEKEGGWNGRQKAKG